jgi:hypothetical protein
MRARKKLSLYDRVLESFEVSELPSLGWVCITWVGVENIYFLYDAHKGVARCGFVKHKKSKGTK